MRRHLPFTKPCWRCRPLSINSGLEKDLIDTCVPAHFTSQRTHRGCLRFWRLEINPPSLKPGIHLNGFALVDKSGNMKKPADYRDLYQTLGTYFVLDPKGEIRCT